MIDDLLRQIIFLSFFFSFFFLPIFEVMLLKAYYVRQILLRGSYTVCTVHRMKTLQGGLSLQSSAWLFSTALIVVLDKRKKELCCGWLGKATVEK